MEKVSSIHGILHKHIEVHRPIKLMVRILLGRCDVECIILTSGGDQLQCW